MLKLIAQTNPLYYKNRDFKRKKQSFLCEEVKNDYKIENGKILLSLNLLVN